MPEATMINPTTIEQPEHPRMPAPPVRTLEDWADYIGEAHRKEVEAIILKGRRLLEANEALPYGDWEKLFKGHPNAVANPIPFSVATAKMYMAICTHPVLSNRNLSNDLPTSWRTLYELTLLPESVLLANLRNGVIRSETTRAEVHAWRQMLEKKPLTRSRKTRRERLEQCIKDFEALEQTEARNRAWMTEESCVDDRRRATTR
jgi:hypothetical protein